MTDAQLERFLSRIEISETGCWLWTAKVNGGGYPSFTYDNGTMGHRAAYEHWKEGLGKGFTVDHICHPFDCVSSRANPCIHRRCVNPQHLAKRTYRENSLRSDTLTRQHALTTHCPRGHEYDEANTYRHGGLRFCRKCHVLSEQRRNWQRNLGA